MAKSPNGSARSQKTPTDPEKPGVQGEPEYASGANPLLWFGIPFLLLVLYGLLN